MKKQNDRLDRCTRKLKKLTLQVQKQNTELLHIIQEIKSQSRRF